jgi:hypothetical protein
LTTGRSAADLPLETLLNVLVNKDRMSVRVNCDKPTGA